MNSFFFIFNFFVVSNGAYPSKPVGRVGVCTCSIVGVARFVLVVIVLLGCHAFKLVAHVFDLLEDFVVLQLEIAVETELVSIKLSAAAVYVAIVVVATSFCLLLASVAVSVAWVLVVLLIMWGSHREDGSVFL